MKRLLFVDDDRMLLEAYQEALSGEAGHWEVATASGGVEALRLMEGRPFDVVATDMEMPGMSGAELLNLVIKRHPQMSRIMISGISDQAEIVEALGFTHQFIAKPVELAELQDVLARLDGLDVFLNNEKLKALVGRFRVLPSFPRLYFEIMKAIEAPDTPMETIDDLILKDPALMTKMLQVVNSAAVGLPEIIQGPARSHPAIGTEHRSFAGAFGACIRELYSGAETQFPGGNAVEPFGKMRQHLPVDHAVGRRGRPGFGSRLYRGDPA